MSFPPPIKPAAKPVECDLTGKDTSGKPCSTPALAPVPAPAWKPTFTPPAPYLPAGSILPPSMPAAPAPPVLPRVSCAVKGKTKDTFTPMDGCPHCATAEATEGIQTGLKEGTLARVEINTPAGQVLAKKHTITHVPRIVHHKDDGTEELCQVSMNGEALCEKETILYDCSPEEIEQSKE